MTAVDVDALDKLREAATAGEWRLGTHDAPGEGQEVLCANGSVADTWEPADAALIVAMHNALPEMLAEVRRGRALRERIAQAGAAGLTAITVESLLAVTAAVDAAS